MAFSALDCAVTVASLVLVFGMSIYSSVTKRKGQIAENFFLAGRNMPWWICAASLFASNIGTEHFVGQAGAAASGGIAVGLYEWSAAYLLLMLGWIFAPVYLQCALTTIPEYLELRYNKYCRYLFVIVTLISYVLSKIGASVYAGAVVLKTVTGLNIWQSIPIIIVGTALYTILGGLTAVMVTHTVQMCVFVVGGLIGTVMSLNLVGGMGKLFDIFRERDLEYFTHMIHPANDRDYPWPGMLIGMPIASVWYWCLDQEMAQRVLSARNLKHAQIGTATAGFMKILPVFITVVPGMVARALFEECSRTNGALFPDWCADSSTPLSDGNAADEAYPLLVLREFPSGIRGVMVASFLAALMSSVSSVYNSASTVFTYDIYQRLWYPNGDAPARKLVIVGRLTTIVLTLLTFLWLPVISASKNGLFLVVQNATMHLAPTVSAIFILALFWKRANGPGALTGFMSGTVFGLARLSVTFVTEGKCAAYTTEGPEGRLQEITASNWFMCMNFLHFAIILFVFTAVIIIAVSLLTAPPPPEQVQGLMFWDTLGNKKAYEKVADSGQLSSALVNEQNEENVPNEPNPFVLKDAEIGQNACSSTGGQVAGSGDCEANNESKNVDEELDDPVDPAPKSTKGADRVGRIVANVLGIAVLIIITSLIIAVW